MQLATGAHTTFSVPNPQPFPPPGPAALERAFDAHHAMVFRAAYRVTGNAADAEDVLQTVFLRLAGRDLSVEVIDNPEGYLRRAAVNASLNLLAQRARRNVPLESAPEPHAGSDQQDLREVLRLAMATLGGRTAEMFALRFIEGHSNGEIADMFGVSSLVVGVTLHRARRQLQKEIRQLGGLK
ncbi:MAG: sigma-70 family RNA polymerase sigma factor [Acidobacteriota bacterium]